MMFGIPLPRQLDYCRQGAHLWAHRRTPRGDMVLCRACLAPRAP